MYQKALDGLQDLHEMFKKMKIPLKSLEHSVHEHLYMLQNMSRIS
jgi:hypothetical protein